MLAQWRAGLRVSEALALEVQDLNFADSNPTVKVRKGKGSKDRLVPMHSELAVALRSFLAYSNTRRGKLFCVNRTTAWRWVQDAATRATQLNQIPPGKDIGTHTLRHSAARWWLACGVPINHVSRWLGHASITTTLIYLEVLPDPTGYMDKVT
jgi:integrase